MKKITIIIILFCSNFTSYTQIDTSKYLRDTISPNKNFFIGKQLIVLLDSLKLKPRNETFSVGKKINRDSLLIKGLTLFFKPYTEENLTDQNYFYGQYMSVEFVTPFPVALYYFHTNSLLGAWYWNAFKKQFYGQHIVKEIRFGGL